VQRPRPQSYLPHQQAALALRRFRIYAGDEIAPTQLPFNERDTLILLRRFDDSRHRPGEQQALAGEPAASLKALAALPRKSRIRTSVLTAGSIRRNR
jgi:hypothetical protein